MKYAAPGTADSIVTVQPRYDNFIGGKWLPPVSGKYRVNLSPATARPICEVAESTPEDIDTPWTPRTRPPPNGARRRLPSAPRC